MSSSKKENNLLTGAIVFASVAIAASIVFFGTQLGGGASLSSPAFENRVEEIVDDYIAKVISGEINPGVDVSTVDEDDDAFIGDKNAPVTIIEFSDYECPFCTRFFNDTLPQLKAEYIDTGKVKLVYRDFPLSSHANAMPAAIAAECAREQGDDSTYFAFHDKIFTGGKVSRDILIGYGQQLDLDMDKFTSCVDDQKYLEEVQKDQQDGIAAGVSGTPAFIINGQLLSGAQPFEAFQQVIEAELSQ